VPQFYVENSHPAIIDPETFDMAQEEIIRRKAHGKQQSGLGCFSSRLVCGECGGFFGSKIWHSTSPYRRTIWRCNRKYNGGEKCGTPHIYEDDIKQAFVKMLNMIIDGGSHRVNITEIFDDTQENAALTDELRAELEVVGELIRKCVEENARAPQDQAGYQQRYDALTARYRGIEEKLKRKTAKRRNRAVTRENAASALAEIDRGEILTEFDEALWSALVASVTVDTDGGMSVMFKDGRTVNTAQKT
jgi:hypothetical protein